MENESNILLNNAVAARTADYYDKRWVEKGERISSHQRLRLQFIVNALEDCVSSGSYKLLDLGCGNGWMTPFLSPYGRVTGVDFSRKAIGFANDRYGRDGNFYVADPSCRKLGIREDGLFDVIISSEVIEHTKDPLAFLQQAASFLRLDGYLVLTTPNANAWREFQHRHAEILQPVENWLKPRQLHHLLCNAGFKVLRHEGGAVESFRAGPLACLQHELVNQLFHWVKMERLYGRILLSIALYQMVVAKKN